MSAPQARNWPFRLSRRSAAVAERWFPDAYVFAVLAVVLVAACAIGFGSSPADTVGELGEGFWSLFPFPLHFPFWWIGCSVAATPPVMACLLVLLALVPTTRLDAIRYVGLVRIMPSPLRR